MMILLTAWIKLIYVFIYLFSGQNVIFRFVLQSALRFFSPQ